MDLAVIDTMAGSEEGRWFEPVGLKGESLGLKLRLAGPDSKQYNVQKDALQKELYARIAAKAGGGSGLVDLDLKEKTEAEREAEFYAGLTLDWAATAEGDSVTFNGEPYPFSRANAERFYTRSGWVRAQVKAFVESRLNFTPPESPS